MQLQLKNSQLIFAIVLALISAVPAASQSIVLGESGDITADGAVTAPFFFGSGLFLTDVNAATFGGLAPIAYQKRVITSCSGQAISSIDENGGVSCQDVAPSNVLYVGDPGIPSTPFKTIGQAVASIVDAAVDNPYLIKVGPGTFFEGVVLPEHVSLQGSGRDLTKISSSLTNSFNAATLVGTASSHVSDLTVIHPGSLEAVAIKDVASLRNVRAQATGAAGGGKARAIYLQNIAHVRLFDIEASAEAGSDVGSSAKAIETPVGSAASDVIIERAVVSADSGRSVKGIHLSDSGSVEIRDVRVITKGPGDALELQNFSGTIDYATIIHDGVGKGITGKDLTIRFSDIKGMNGCGTGLSLGGNSRLSNSRVRVDGDCSASSIGVGVSGSPSGTIVTVHNSQIRSNGRGVNYLGSGSSTAAGSIFNSVVLSTNGPAVEIDGPTNVVGVYSSTLIGGVEIVSGTVTCYGNVDPDSGFYSATCPLP